MSYEKQGLIYFTCHNITIMPEKKDYIDKLCYHVAGEYAEPLYIALTTRNNVEYIALQYHMCERNLRYYMDRFYKMWKFDGYIPEKQKYTVKSGKDRKNTNEKIALIAEAYKKEKRKNRSKNRIAKQLNMNYDTVKRYFKKYAEEIENS